MLCLGGAIIGLMNQLSQSLMSVAIGALTSILVLAPLVGIQLASQVAVQVVLAMLAGAVVIGAMSVARGAPFLPSKERRLFVLPNRLQPMVPFQLMFMGVPLLIVSLLADSPASLVSAALLGALLVTIPWPSRNKSWQRGSWQGVSSSHRRSSLVGPNIQGAHTQTPHGRFEKFSEGARSVLSHAQEEAQWFNHNYIGTEYILLGLVREPEGVAAKVLTMLATSKNGTHWEPRDQGLDGGLVSSLRALCSFLWVTLPPFQELTPPSDSRVFLPLYVSHYR